MERRGWTVLIGTVLVALLTAASLLVKVPYVALGPGPTVDTLGTVDGTKIITVQRGTASKSTGQLRLVTVSVSDDLTLWTALYDWWDDRYAVVPRDAVYPPDQTEQQTDKQQQQQFQDSQTAAETAAYRELGCAVDVTVKSVAAGSGAAGKLKAGDVLDSVDGKPVTSTQNLVTLVQDKAVGSTREIGYTRDGKARTATITTGKGDSGKAALGVTVTEKQPCKYRVKVSLGEIGGPSAGMMFALGIVDTLTPADLTGGKVIAGTGEIDADGKVGPIGGIQQKLLGARRDGATVFLTPAGNCAQAKGSVPDGLKLVKVSTLHGALQALSELRAGKPTPSC
ncbi:YlbL family protein [Actinocatenispora comari]|jgi:PDZ domain-containing protein|uniref:endopeptidase La n=1 Tax=Actinocatenispora comari TaxID=2807577 RepID=A0A8J4ADL7_9ACTN|nr:PDZ domain-containing protein [Actinocatenispora comari]GIL27710.1 PDZ domain-containing protein [Actinocatenispora comari]